MAFAVRKKKKRKLAFSFFKRNRFDIIFLQKTLWTVDLDMQINFEWEGDAFFAHGTNSSRDVAILITSRLDYYVRQIRSDSDGRVVNILVDVEDETISLVNVYAPSSDFQRRIFFSERQLNDPNKDKGE